MEETARQLLTAPIAWAVTPLFGVMKVDHLGTRLPAERLPVEEAQGSFLSRLGQMSSLINIQICGMVILPPVSLRGQSLG